MKTNLIERMKKELDKLNNENSRKRSAWGRGVATYTAEIMDTLREYDRDPEDVKDLESMMFNGADSWDSYISGGCSLIYDSDIAETLCTPSELKKTRNGERRPNSREEWLDTQARALTQASRRVKMAYRKAVEA